MSPPNGVMRWLYLNQEIRLRIMCSAYWKAGYERALRLYLAATMIRCLDEYGFVLWTHWLKKTEALLEARKPEPKWYW